MKLVWSGRSDLDGFEVAACADGHTRVALAQLVADHG